MVECIWKWTLNCIDYYGNYIDVELMKSVLTWIKCSVNERLSVYGTKLFLLRLNECIMFEILGLKCLNVSKVEMEFYFECIWITLMWKFGQVMEELNVK